MSSNKIIAVILFGGAYLEIMIYRLASIPESLSMVFYMMAIVEVIVGAYFLLIRKDKPKSIEK